MIVALLLLGDSSDAGVDESAPLEDAATEASGEEVGLGKGFCVGCEEGRRVATTVAIVSTVTVAIPAEATLVARSAVKVDSTISANEVAESANVVLREVTTSKLTSHV